MRIPISTDLKNRTGGSLNKDAKLMNSYVETKPQTNPNAPPESIVRKRPIAQGGVVTGTGIAQGGIWFNKLYLVNGDVLVNYTGAGTNWNSGTTYAIGDMVSDGFVDYWAINSNSNDHPPSGNWSRTYIPPIPAVAGWTLGSASLTSGGGNNPIGWNGSIYVYLINDPISGFDTPFTSSDGLSWTKQAATTFAISGGYSLQTIWNGTQFLAVGDSTTGVNYSATSPDGINWTLQFDAGFSALFDVAWNGFVYCGVHLSNIYTSPDGITWTLQTSPITVGSLYAIVWNGLTFCTVSRGSSQAATSPDGITWTLRALPASTTWERIKTLGSLLCATCVTDNKVAVSSDNGATWSSSVLSLAQGGGLAAGSGLFLSTTVSVSTASYCTSPDGITWTTRTLPTAKTWQSATFGNKFVVMDNSTFSATSATGT